MKSLLMLFFCFAMFYFSTGYTTNSEKFFAGPWISIACSTDGNHIVALQEDGGYTIYISSDKGATWKRHEIDAKYVMAVTCSDDGSLIAGCFSEGGAFGHAGVFTSSDGGEHFIKHKLSGSRLWSSVTSSADGSHLAACLDNSVMSSPDVWTSEDGGNTWTEHKSVGYSRWKSIACSTDGSKLVVCDAFSNVLLSEDYGVNWNKKPPLTTDYESFLHISCSYNASLIVYSSAFAGTDNNNSDNNNKRNINVYISTDEGLNWTKKILKQTVLSSTCSYDGSNIFVFSGQIGDGFITHDIGGYIDISTDGGTSWSEQKAPLLCCITCSSNGSFIAGGDSHGYIYISTDSGKTWTSNNTYIQSDSLAVTNKVGQTTNENTPVQKLKIIQSSLSNKT